MVVFKNIEGDDTLTLITDEIEERLATNWGARSRYVTALSVAGCLLTSLAVVTTVSVYWTLNTETLKESTDSQDQGECQFVSLHKD